MVLRSIEPPLGYYYDEIGVANVNSFQFVRSGNHSALDQVLAGRYIRYARASPSLLRRSERIFIPTVSEPRRSFAPQSRTTINPRLDSRNPSEHNPGWVGLGSGNMVGDVLHHGF